MTMGDSGQSTTGSVLHFIARGLVVVGIPSLTTCAFRDGTISLREGIAFASIIDIEFVSCLLGIIFLELLVISWRRKRSIGSSLHDFPLLRVGFMITLIVIPSFVLHISFTLAFQDVLFALYIVLACMTLPLTIGIILRAFINKWDMVKFNKNLHGKKDLKERKPRCQEECARWQHQRRQEGKKNFKLDADELVFHARYHEHPRTSRKQPSRWISKLCCRYALPILVGVTMACFIICKWRKIFTGCIMCVVFIGGIIYKTGVRFAHEKFERDFLDLVGGERVEPHLANNINAWSWRDPPPVYFFLHQEKLLNNLKPEHDMGFYYSMELHPMTGMEFVKHAGLKPSWNAKFSGMEAKTLDSWMNSKGGAWGFRYCIGCMGDGKMENHDELITLEASLSSLYGPGTLVPIERVKPMATCFFGDELETEINVQSTLAPDVIPFIPVEVDHPTCLENDITVGKVFEPESIATTCDAGFMLDHLKRGCGIFGGEPRERINLIRTIIKAPISLPRVIIDDHGDFHVPGARVMFPGRNLKLNPAIPAFYDMINREMLASMSMEHVNLLVTMLNALLEWSSTEKASFFNKYTLELRKTLIDGFLPNMNDLGFLDEESKFGNGSTVRDKMEVLLGGNMLDCYSFEDQPGFDRILGEHDIIFDLSHLHGVQKQAFKAFLLIKIVELSKFQATQGKLLDFLLVVPEIDKLITGNERFRDKGKDTALDKIFGGLSSVGTRFACSCQSASKISSNMVHRMGCIIAFRQALTEDAKIIENVLHLENDQVHNKRTRHSSHQVEFLVKMPRHFAFMKRPDVPSSFIINPSGYQRDKMNGITKRSHSGNDTSILPKEERIKRLINDILRGNDLAIGDIMRFLNRTRMVNNAGIKKSSLKEIISPFVEKQVKHKYPMEPVSKIKKLVHVQVSRILDLLLKHGILAVHGYNPSGMKGDILVKLSSTGRDIMESIEGSETRESEEPVDNNHPRDSILGNAAGILDEMNPSSRHSQLLGLLDKLVEDKKLDEAAMVLHEASMDIFRQQDDAKNTITGIKELEREVNSLARDMRNNSPISPMSFQKALKAYLQVQKYACIIPGVE